VASNQSELLMSVHKIDSEIILRENRVKTISENILKLEKKLKTNLVKLSEINTQEVQATKEHAVEDLKYKEEEKKIIDRRKQISSVGGNKSAKLAERELDIAKRIMESLEKNVLDTMMKLEALQTQKLSITNSVDELKVAFQSKSKEGKDEIEKLTSELKDLTTTKTASFSKLDPRVSSLYKRVESRHRGDAVAIASNGSCRACFRSLPAQMFNQVMAGYNLVQCPGCSRILVHLEGETQEAV